MYYKYKKSTNPTVNAVKSVPFNAPPGVRPLATLIKSQVLCQLS